MTKYRNDLKDDQEYIGKIWGWRISLLSLALILVMLAIMGARYCYLQQDSSADTTEIIPEK